MPQWDRFPGQFTPWNAAAQGINRHVYGVDRYRIPLGWKPKKQVVTAYDSAIGPDNIERSIELGFVIPSDNSDGSQPASLLQNLTMAVWQAKCAIEDGTLDDSGASPPVEVTPAMIEAGKDVIESCWTEFTGPLGFQLWDKVLSEVFLAMSAAKDKP